MSSWIDAREVQSEKANLQILFDKYVPVCLDTLRVRFKKITPVPDITMVTTLCYLLECLLTPANTPPDCNKELYELYFVFAAVWAFGGAMFQDQVNVKRCWFECIASILTHILPVPCILHREMKRVLQFTEIKTLRSIRLVLFVLCYLSKRSRKLYVNSVLTGVNFPC